MVEKVPTVLEKLPQNLRGDFLLTLTVITSRRQTRLKEDAETIVNASCNLKRDKVERN